MTTSTATTETDCVLPRSLPANPSPEFYRKQAKALYKAFRRGQTSDVLRIEEMLGGSRQRDVAPVKLSDAQTVIAREHGCANWPQFLALIDGRREHSYRQRLREKFAENICAYTRISADNIRNAFSQVPREHFLGAPPWRFPEFYSQPYIYSFDDRLESVYADVQVDLNQGQPFSNGIPSTQAKCLEALNPQNGENVLHIGSGSGYYTAILAALVGEQGRVYYQEQDAGLAEQAGINLSHLAQVSAIHEGTAFDAARPYDIIYINAGVSAIQDNWLDALNEGGRLLLSLTASYGGYGGSPSGFGETLLVTRHGASFQACFLPFLNYFGRGYFPDFGKRDARANQQLKTAYAGKRFRSVRSLRFDRHKPDDSCWLHQGTCCLSKKAA